MWMKALAVPLVCVALTGCKTSMKVVAGENVNVGALRSAHLVQHEAKPDDMDVKMQKALEAQKLTVTASTAASANGADLLVKYDDHWAWDMAMYLRSLEVQFYDGRSGALLATGQWSDSAFHGFRDSQKVCVDLTAEMLKKIGGQPAP